MSSHSATSVSSSNVGGSSGSALANGACTAYCGPPTWVRFSGARATPRCASSAAGSKRTTRAAGCSRRPPNDAIVVEVALPWRSPPARKPSADEVKCAVRSEKKPGSLPVLLRRGREYRRQRVQISLLLRRCDAPREYPRQQSSFQAAGLPQSPPLKVW